MSSFSYTETLKNSQGNRIYLVNATVDDGDRSRRAWYYILVDKLKIPMYQRAIKMKTIGNLEDFGRVIHSGWGEYPPQLVVNAVKEEFGEYK